MLLLVTATTEDDPLTVPSLSLSSASSAESRTCDCEGCRRRDRSGGRAGAA